MDALGAKTALPGSAGDAATTPPQIAVVAQLVSLTTWGNALLSRGADIAFLNRDHSTLKTCNKVAFSDIRGLLRSREVPIAADPLTWLKLLHEEGCPCIRLRHGSAAEPENAKKASGAVPGSEPDWKLETIFDEANDRWRPRWSLTNRYAAQNRRWSVVYTRVERKVPLATEATAEAEPLCERLGNALAEMQEFAARQNQTQWAECLTQAKALLDSEKPFQDSAFHDLLPRVGGTPAARQILAACCQALACEVDKSIAAVGSDPEQDRADYDRLTASLRGAIIKCVEHSANMWAANPSPSQADGQG